MIDYEKKVQALIDSYKLNCNLKYADKPGLVGPKFQYTAFQCRVKYFQSTKTDPDNSHNYLNGLITLYLENRDFTYALFCIGKYIAHKYPKYEIFANFLKELELIFSEMETKLRERKQKDVFLIMLDSVREKDIKHMPFLDNINTFRFTKAYSPSTYTRSSVRGMFTGEKLFDNGMWKDTSYIIDPDKSELLQFLKDDYTLLNLSGFRFLPEEDGTKFPFIITKDDEGVLLTSYKEGESIKYATPTIFWQYLCEVLQSEKPVFAIALCEEFHSPCMCAWHDERPEMLLRLKHYTEKRYTEEGILPQVKETLKYLDSELHFLMSFNSPGYKVICGDHGQMLGEKGHFGAGMTWYDEAFHIPLMVSGLDGKTDELYSTLDLGPLIMDLIKTDGVMIPEREFVEVQRDHLYDKRFIAPEFSKELGEKFLFPFRAVIGKDDKLVVYRTDTEHKVEYYINDEPQDMEFHHERVNEMIEVIS